MHRPVPHNMVKRPIHRLKDGVPFPELDELADESIITITNDGKNVVRLLASPFDLGDLAFGHIICEGRGTVTCLLYTSPSPRDGLLSRMPSSA